MNKEHTIKIEAEKLADMHVVPEEFVRSVGHPLIVMRRHERAVPIDETSYDAPKATYIDGYDKDGTLVSTRGLYERSSGLGKVWQNAMETWKVSRVKRELGKSAISLNHVELREYGL